MEEIYRSRTKAYWLTLAACSRASMGVGARDHERDDSGLVIPGPESSESFRFVEGVVVQR